MAWDLVGHERPLGLLRAAFAEDRLPRAQLFTGPRGVGKRTLALALAPFETVIAADGIPEGIAVPTTSL